MSNFFQAGEADPAYELTRDHPSRETDKQRIENMWNSYEPYSEHDFTNRTMQAGQFAQCMWEMYLACTLLDSQHALQERTGNPPGPDITVSANGIDYHIEATAPGPGTGPDAVPGLIDGVVNDVPEESTILRITQSIVQKYNQHQNWLSRGTVSEDAPYIVAINISDACMISGDFIPYILKAVFGLGYPQIVFNPETGERIDNEWSFRRYIEKRNGERINTNYFQVADYSRISAIIYSGQNFLYKPREMGEEFTVVHNPLADNPVPHGLFAFGTEYWAVDGRLQKRVHMTADGGYI